MPRYEVTSPDGKRWEVDAPDGATQDQVLAYAQQQWSAQPKPQAPPMPRTEKIGMGMLDPISGGAQLLTRALPDGVVRAGNRLNNWLADKGVPLARLEGPDEVNLTSLVTGEKATPTAPLDRLIKKQEAEYQAKREAAGESGFDGYRTIGNIISPANASIARLMPMGGTLGAKMLAGTAGGAAGGALQPVLGEDFASEKLAQMRMGAAGGAAAPALTSGLARLISPRASTDAGLQLLKDKGVRTTIGQTLGGTAARIEEKAMSIPLVGDAIRGARQRGVSDMNRAVADEALAPIGRRLPADLQGREAVAHVQRALSNAYESVLPKLTVKADNMFGQEIASLRQMVNTGAMDPKAASLFNRVLKNDVLGKFKGQASLTGKTLKQVEGDLSEQISRLGQSTDADARLVGDALKEVQSSLRTLASRSNPELAGELSKINQGWANFKRLERAGSYVGAEDGTFSAAHLQSAVKALDRSKDKGRFARGDALMQDLADAAKGRLGGRVPDSGTAGRLGMVGVGAAGVADPMLTALTLGGGSLLYSAPMQAILRGAVSMRPQAAQPVAGLLSQAAPVLAPAGGLLSLEAFKQ